MAAGEEVLALQAEVAQREEELSSLKQRLAAALLVGQESARSVPSRQLVLPELGVQRQRLAAAAVLIMGCGARRGGARLPAGADVVDDCSDNAPTRYLVSDARVLAGRPLVSASALRFEGQLTVYHYGGGPCYRCTVTNCADGGVLGAVTGAISAVSGCGGAGPTACGEQPTVADLQDQESFCGSSAADKGRSLRLLSPEERISVMDCKRLLDSGAPHLLLDVRPQVEVDICRLPHALHIPLKRLERWDAESLKVLGEAICEGKQGAQERASVPIYAICKLGSDSESREGPALRTLWGGLMAWAPKIDGAFPQY
ncbi:hypothetical protein FD755_019112 [Muntiacus reevesi]|uniref:Rhodanese domain-containing protein n=1 Tax=Muntiacus reevesi TaxID=9886 RepID=A0A5N3X9P2_MUNRE|nr:hypothetical protein FD755_019112 [Muntiacus reevesi]